LKDAYLQDRAEPNWQEEFEERAAILEHDAGLSREKAEVIAREIVERQKAKWKEKHDPR